MADSNDINQAVSVSDAVHHTPFAYPDTPEVACTFQLHDSGRTWVLHQRLDLLEDAPCNLGIKILQFFTRRSRKDNGVISHAPYAWRGFRQDVLRLRGIRDDHRA